MYGSQIKHCHLIKQILFYFFVSQDALQERYNKEGKFPGPTIISRRRPWTLLNFLFWATLLLSPLINFACGVVVSGSPLLIIGFILFLIIGSINLLFRIKVNEAQYLYCSHSSSYFLSSQPPLLSAVSSGSQRWRKQAPVMETKRPRNKTKLYDPPTPPPVFGCFCTATLQCLIPTLPLHSPRTVSSVGRPGRRPTCENIIDTRVKNPKSMRGKSCRLLVFYRLWRGRHSTVVCESFVIHPAPFQVLLNSSSTQD